MASILIVDDEKATVALLTKALTNAGHTVTAAEDGHAGIEIARRTKPQLVIMDMSMPKLTGWEATRRLKADPETQAIRILGLSSAATAGDRDEAYDAGCDGYESKPLDIKRLLARVAELTG